MIYDRVGSSTSLLIITNHHIIIVITTIVIIITLIIIIAIKTTLASEARVVCLGEEAEMAVGCHSTGLQGMVLMVMGVMILILVPTVMTDDHDNCVEKSNLREELLYSLRNALKRLPVTSQDYSEPERCTAADVGGSVGDFGVLGPSDFGDGDRLMPLIRCINNNNKCAEDDVPTSGQLRAIFSAERAAPPISFLRARLLRSWSSSFSYDIIITITIITIIAICTIFTSIITL